MSAVAQPTLPSALHRSALGREVDMAICGAHVHFHGRYWGWSGRDVSQRSEVAAHMMRVTETAHWLEWQNWADPVLQRPYEIKDGLLHVPDIPGLGLEWKEDVIATHRVDL